LNGLLYVASNYASCSGTYPVDGVNNIAPFWPCDGIYCKVDGSTDAFYAAAAWGGLGAPYGRTTTIAAITDGLSNTVAWSERIKGVGHTTTDAANGGPIIDGQSPTTNAYYVPEATALPNFSNNPGASLSPAQMAADIQTAYTQCQQATALFGSQTGSSLRVWSQAWWVGNYWGAHFNNGMTPNGKPCTAGSDNFSYESSPALSLHPGGVNVGMGDGSIKFIKTSVSPQIWWALGTRAGGEVISSDQY
jgi:prepilin-type processing-associated H-X9-DG protein